MQLTVINNQLPASHQDAGDSARVFAFPKLAKWCLTAPGP